MARIKDAVSKYKYPIIVLLIGLFLLLLPSKGTDNEKSVATDDELRLERTLESSVGVGNVSVLISDNGVVVVCDGADNSGVKLSIIKAVEVFTGLSSDKIEILKTAD